MSEGINNTEEAIKYCNERLKKMQKLEEETETSTEFKSESDRLKALVSISGNIQFWFERLDSMLRLADKQGKGVQQLSSFKPDKYGRRKKPEGVEPNVTE